MHQSQGRTWPYSLPVALLLMAPFDFLASLAMDVYLPVVSDMPQQLGTSALVVQLTLSAYLLILGLGQLVFGPLSDRVGRRPVVLCGAATYAVACFCLAGTSDGGLFLCLRVLQALGASAALVATFATVRDVYGGRPESSVVYGLLSSMLAIVPALGPLLGALLAETLGWRSIFVVLGALASLAWLHAAVRWHETAPESVATSRSGFAVVLANGKFWVYTLGFSSAMGAFFVFFSTAPRVLISGAGYTQMEFSLAFATVALVMMVVARLSGRLVGAWGVLGCFAAGTGAMLLGAVVISLCALFHEATFATFVVPMWVVAAGIVLIVSVSANGALEAFDDKAGTAVALYYAIQGVVVGVVGTMATLALDGATPWPLVGFCALMCTVNAVGMLWLRKGRSVAE